MGRASRFIDTNELSSPPHQNWWWRKVQLADNFADCPNKIGGIEHEIGHGMGLAHDVGATYSVMNYAFLDAGTKGSDS